MDELQRNDLLPEEEAHAVETEEEEVTDENEGSEGEKLREELEDLRDLFQSELDKALSGEDEGILIQELEEEEETEDHDRRE